MTQQQPEAPLFSRPPEVTPEMVTAAEQACAARGCPRCHPFVDLHIARRFIEPQIRARGYGSIAAGAALNLLVRESWRHPQRDVWATYFALLARRYPPVPGHQVRPSTPHPMDRPTV